MVHSRNDDQRRLVWLSEEDLSAAARLLAAIGASPKTRDHQEGANAARATTTADRADATKRASLSLHLRQRRMECLGEMFANEPPFQMLLALYVSEDREPDITAVRLGNLAWLAQSTALRWVDPLIAGGWISRADVPQDARKSDLRLTAKAYDALDNLFAWPA